MVDLVSITSQPSLGDRYSFEELRMAHLEIPSLPDAFPVGSPVEHRKFGAGIVKYIVSPSDAAMYPGCYGWYGVEFTEAS